MPVLGNLQHLRQYVTFSCLHEENEALVEVKLVELILLAQGQPGYHGNQASTVSQVRIR